VPRRQRDLIARGEVWDADIPGVGVHPVVVATRDSAVNCDNLFTLPKTVLTRRRGRLGPTKVRRFDEALAVALGLS